MKAFLIALAALAISVAACGDRPSTRMAVYSSTLDATVRVSRKVGGHGSGVFISPRLILTAAHVVGDQPSLVIYPEHGKPRNGQPVWVDKDRDLALIFVTEPGRSRLRLRCEQPKLGEEVYLVGHPAWLKSTVFAGRIASSKLQSPDGVRLKPLLVVDITGIPGNSGGPLVDQGGRIVGIITNAVIYPTFGPSMGPPVKALVPVMLVVPGNVVCNVLRKHGWRA